MMFHHASSENYWFSSTIRCGKTTTANGFISWEPSHGGVPVEDIFLKAKMQLYLRQVKEKREDQFKRFSRSLVILTPERELIQY